MCVSGCLGVCMFSVCARVRDGERGEKKERGKKHENGRSCIVCECVSGLGLARALTLKALRMDATHVWVQKHAALILSPDHPCQVDLTHMLAHVRAHTQHHPCQKGVCRVTRFGYCLARARTHIHTRARAHTHIQVDYLAQYDGARPSAWVHLPGHGMVPPDYEPPTDVDGITEGGGGGGTIDLFLDFDAA